MGTDRSRRNKERQLRAARRRLQPIRGARGRSLKHTRLAAPRVVGLSQFAQGLTGPSRKFQPRRKSTAWILSALPFGLLVIWVVVRVAGHR